MPSSAGMGAAAEEASATTGLKGGAFGFRVVLDGDGAATNEAPAEGDESVVGGGAPADLAPALDGTASSDAVR